ncbi:TetR/AcrR family transcriptional regulator C-terminal domain-containing protein [Actinoplanes sp. CA-142083]|uniref:TetR/AcrR family transcriptional regulator C-terminal domain-containing protein n=1 Tax=Actinoplanes sp. CA-142083 TaxID=3239903 RepID=UPI003D8BF12B
MKLTPDAIARAALKALNEVGLDGLTMRVLAKELGVQAPTLYWHVKNKQELLDAMADLLAAEAAEGLEAPRRDETWQEWLIAMAVRNRHTLLRYRDGARVAAGAYSAHPAVLRTIELILRTLQDAGFEPATAARAFPVILHYTIGFTIEEQARAGTAYERNPYAGGLRVDAERYPLTAGVAGDLYDEDTDANFEYGLRIVLSGMSRL